jgi:nucleotide-binding universal stress UspA family protein
MLGPANRKVDLMYVIPKAPDEAQQPLKDRLYRRARYILGQMQALLANEKVSASPSVRNGSPARILVGASRNYDVTIVGASSRGLSTVAGLGPIASRVAEHAHGAVLLARETQNEGGLRILATADGSENSLAALRLMAELINLREAEITLLHVAETPWLHAGPDQEWLGYEEEREEEIDPQAQLQTALTKEGEAILLAARDQLPGATVDTVVREGLPADEILSEANSGSYDLVVTGTSGSTDLKHKILGSVSSKIAWFAPCSVLVVGSASERE